MRFIIKTFGMVDLPAYCYGKTTSHKYTCGKISVLWIFLMVMIVKEAICIPSSELYGKIPNDISRHKRQLAEDESRPHGHATVNIR